MKVEGDDVCAIEVAESVQQLKATLQMRSDDDFLSFPTAAVKDELVADGHDGETLTAQCRGFFGTYFIFLRLNILHN